jgi:CRISPR-associated protein Cmr6
MTEDRRSKLQPSGSADHAGLLLTRFLEKHKPTDPEKRNKLKHTPEEELLIAAMEVKASETYQFAFNRCKNSLYSPETSFTAELASSLAIGLGNESPLEVGLTVHHTYGMPIIPGSAIKGLCRRGALALKQEKKVSDEQFYTLFGSTKENGGKDSAGFITFYDAWYDPDSVEGKPFHRDVITVHHKGYYSSKGQSPPTDFDDPRPVPFLVVKKGARFLFAVHAPSKEWGDFTIKLLKWSLANLGVGGKTNAGYGYFKAEGQTGTAPSKQSADAQQQTVPITGQIQKWENVTVRLNPGTGDMVVQHEGQKANVIGSSAQALRSGLPEEAMNKLRSQRQIKADVEVENKGNQWTIVKIMPKGVEE